ncbi:hypothetical protein D3C71_1377240 [compost metagenome]
MVHARYALGAACECHHRIAAFDLGAQVFGSGQLCKQALGVAFAQLPALVAQRVLARGPGFAIGAALGADGGGVLAAQFARNVQGELAALGICEAIQQRLQPALQLGEVVGHGSTLPALAGTHPAAPAATDALVSLPQQKAESEQVFHRGA